MFLDGYPQVPWELWTVQKERLLKWECNQSLNYSADYPAFKDNWLTSAGLRSAQEENVTLLAASIAKAEKYFPENAKELREFRNEFNALLAGELAGHEIVKLSYLVNVNAVLSRYTSQTFSGSSPIIETECHFWTHSLLGVGVATQALVKFRRFIDKSTELHSPIVKLASYQNRLPYRFKSDNGENVFTTTLFELSSSEYDTRWKPLEKIVSESNVKSSQKSNKELPLLVCFSGRDGFKSTMFSLTAPLEVISCCNTYGWTPMTLTHELCHVWVSDALGMLFPEMLDPTRFKDLERLKDGIPPASLFEQIQQAFYYCFTLLHKESVGAILSKVPKGKQKSAIQILASQSRTIEELITHILDFRFFYKKNQGLYVNSIWSSWDVIPSIRDRLPHYIMRTACAILSDKLNEENCLEETLKVLATYLADLHSITENGQYLAEAIQLLDEQKKEFLARLDARSFLVRMIVTFFPSGDFSTSLEHERPVKGGMYNSMSPGKFKVGESI